MIKAIIIGIIITIISIAALSSVENNSVISDTPTTETTNSNNVSASVSSSSKDEIKVSIAGEVLYPGDYYLSSDATLSDLIEAAGGLTSKADNKAFNPGILISNHTNFYIAPGSEKESTCVETSISKVNINTATATELNSIGFTTTQSKAIVDYRNESGKFVCLEDLLNVKGIGQGTFEKVKNKVTIS